MAILVIIAISAIYLDIKECLGNEMEGSRGINEKSSESPQEIKEEIVSESDTELKVFDDAIRRNNTPYAGMGKLLDNSSFVANYDEKEVKKNMIAFEGNSDNGNYCVPCKIYFRFDRSYERHYREKHPNEIPFPCPYCHSRHAFKKDHILHVRKNHPDKSDFLPKRWHQKMYYDRKCGKCGTTYGGMVALETHALKAHNGEKIMKCADCGETFFRIAQLNRHIRVKHSYGDNDPFKCKICNNVFHRSDVLQGHVIMCQERRKMENARIAPRCPTRLDESVFEKLQQRTTCDECGLKLGSLLKLMEHTRERHPELKIFTCEKCEKSFAKSQSLEKHDRKFHPDSEEVHLRKKYVTLIKYACDVCGVVFEGSAKYEKHVITSHPDAKPFECTACGAAFKRKSNLTQHFKNMHGGEFLPCSYCNNCYGSETILKRHERSCGRKCAKKEAFFCDICLNWRTGSFDQHVFRHDDYDHCEFCEKRFCRENNPRGLSKHLERRHPNRVDANANPPLIAADAMNSPDIKIKPENNENC